MDRLDKILCRELPEYASSEERAATLKRVAESPEASEFVRGYMRETLRKLGKAAEPPNEEKRGRLKSGGGAHSNESKVKPPVSLVPPVKRGMSCFIGSYRLLSNGRVAGVVTIGPERASTIQTGVSEA